MTETNKLNEIITYKHQTALNEWDQLRTAITLKDDNILSIQQEVSFLNTELVTWENRYSLLFDEKMSLQKKLLRH